VRIYRNVRSFGPCISKNHGITYELRLDSLTASKISWANNRRLIFGNLLLLTYDNLQHSIFATVADRSNIQNNYSIMVGCLRSFRTSNKSLMNCFDMQVRPLTGMNNINYSQSELNVIDSSYPLTMIETMTYFEAYRPVLNALQMIGIEGTFPLAPFLLKLNKEHVLPDYMSSRTTYDLTPLLVAPQSAVKTQMSSVNNHPRLSRGMKNILPRNIFRIEYERMNEVALKYKHVRIADHDQWPSSEELHLNTKQRDAMMLALTHKVALIQGRKSNKILSNAMYCS
jgi:hypothetical protein